MPKVATKLRISKKGQISIPKRVREKLGIVPGDMVAFEQVDEGFILKKKKNQSLLKIFNFHHQF